MSSSSSASSSTSGSSGSRSHTGHAHTFVVRQCGLPIPIFRNLIAHLESLFGQPFRLYQLEAIDFALGCYFKKHHGTLLAHEMGLGKTNMGLAILYAIHYLLPQGSGGNVFGETREGTGQGSGHGPYYGLNVTHLQHTKSLILCPKVTIEIVWREWAERLWNESPNAHLPDMEATHSDDVFVFHGPERWHRVEERMAAAKIVITTYDVLLREYKHWKAGHEDEDSEYDDEDDEIEDRRRKSNQAKPSGFGRGNGVSEPLANRQAEPVGLPITRESLAVDRRDNWTGIPIPPMDDMFIPSRRPGATVDNEFNRLWGRIEQASEQVAREAIASLHGSQASSSMSPSNSMIDLTEQEEEASTQIKQEGKETDLYEQQTDEDEHSDGGNSSSASTIPRAAASSSSSSSSSSSRTARHHLFSLFNINWTVVLMDEIHVVKNGRIKRRKRQCNGLDGKAQNEVKYKVSDAVFSLTRQRCRFPVGLSGTPVGNLLREVGAISKALRIEERPRVAFWGRAPPAEVQRFASRFMIRETRESVASQLPPIPPKREFTMFCKLTEPQIVLLSDLMYEATRIWHQRSDRNWGLNMLQIWMRMRACCHAPYLVKDKHHDSNEDSDDEMSDDEEYNDRRRDRSSALRSARSAALSAALGASHRASPQRSVAPVALAQQPQASNAPQSNANPRPVPLALTLTVEEILCQNAKAQALLSIVSDALNRGESIVVFMEFLEGTDCLIRVIQHLFPEQQPLRYDSTVDDKSRNKVVRLFRNAALVQHSILFCGTRAGGVGISLARANVGVLFDGWFNPAVEWQAEWRLWRHGQTKPVRIYRLMSAGRTVDMPIRTILNRKARKVVPVAVPDITGTEYQLEKKHLSSFTEMCREFFKNGGYETREQFQHEYLGTCKEMQSHERWIVEEYTQELGIDGNDPRQNLESEPGQGPPHGPGSVPRQGIHSIPRYERYGVSNGVSNSRVDGRVDIHASYDRFEEQEQDWSTPYSFY